MAAEQEETIYGVIDDAGVETLAFFNTVDGDTIEVGPISGLGTQKIVSMDFRPATGQLYALTDGDELKVISNIHTATPSATPFVTMAPRH